MPWFVNALGMFAEPVELLQIVPASSFQKAVRVAPTQIAFWIIAPYPIAAIRLLGIEMQIDGLGEVEEDTQQKV